MKKILIIAGVLLVLGIGVFFFLGDDYERLLKENGPAGEPRVKLFSDLQMLEYKGAEIQIKLPVRPMKHFLKRITVLAE